MELVIDGIRYYGTTRVAELTGKDPAMIRRVCIRGGAKGAFRAGPLWLVPADRLTDGTFFQPEGRPPLDKLNAVV